MPINKVTYNNTTLIDLSSDTVTADKLLSGYYAHDSAGNIINGILSSGNVPSVGALVVCECSSNITSVVAEYGGNSAGAYISNSVAYVVIPYTYAGDITLVAYTGSENVSSITFTINAIKEYDTELKTETVLYKYDTTSGIYKWDGVAEHTWDGIYGAGDVVESDTDGILWYAKYHSQGFISHRYTNLGISSRGYSKLNVTYEVLNNDYDATINAEITSSSPGTEDMVSLSGTVGQEYTKEVPIVIDSTDGTLYIQLRASPPSRTVGDVLLTKIKKIEFV